jgi:hypothetical protein
MFKEEKVEKSEAPSSAGSNASKINEISFGQIVAPE